MDEKPIDLSAPQKTSFQEQLQSNVKSKSFKEKQAEMMAKMKAETEAKMKAETKPEMKAEPKDDPNKMFSVFGPQAEKRSYCRTMTIFNRLNQETDIHKNIFLSYFEPRLNAEPQPKRRQQDNSQDRCWLGEPQPKRGQQGESQRWPGGDPYAKQRQQAELEKKRKIVKMLKEAKPLLQRWRSLRQRQELQVVWQNGEPPIPLPDTQNKDLYEQFLGMPAVQVEPLEIIELVQLYHRLTKILHIWVDDEENEQRGVIGGKSLRQKMKCFDQIAEKLNDWANHEVNQGEDNVEGSAEEIERFFFFFLGFRSPNKESV